jgi:squalene synthase HpnC
MIHRVGTRKAVGPAVPLPAAPLDLEACYRYCETVAQSHHHNFPVASFLLRSALRKHFWAVYAFARIADDFADEPIYEGRRARELDRWEEQLHACYHGETPQHPVFVALADTVRRFALPITEFTALLSGFRTDLEIERYATYTDLRNYTEQAASPVGHLLLYLGGYREPALHAYADDLACGLALAKLLQDIAADAARGRIYLPAEDLRHFGVVEAEITAGRGADRGSPRLAALVRYEVARTRALFERARPLVEEVEADLSIELALFWHGGMRILDKIQRVGDQILTRRPRLDAADKALVVTRALAWRGRTLPPRLRRRVFGAE